MSPRSSDNNASQTKQKKKTDSPASNPLDSTRVSAASPPLSASVSVDANTGSPAPCAPSVRDALPESPAALAPAPRVFVASALKPVSAFDTVTSTISSLTTQANRGISNLIASHSAAPSAASPIISASADHSTPLRTDGSVSPIYDAFHNAGATPDPARIEAALSDAQANAASAPPPRVLWSRWDRLPLQAHPLKCAPLLISYFDDGTLQVLLVQDRHISELLCLPRAAQALHDSAATSASSHAQLLTAFVRHPTADSTHPQLLLVLQEPDTAARLLAYSLSAHQIQASIPLRHLPLPDSTLAESQKEHDADLWPQVETQCNDRFTVLSFASPPSVHVLSTATLEYIHSPITDVSPAFPNRPSPVSLSHRFLAFTCTASTAVSPVRSDARKISNAAYHDPSRPLAAAHADSSGRVGEMRDNLFETSAHVGDAARRIKGGVISGVRTLGEWGSSYWPGAGSPPSTAAFSPPRPSLLSQSAPHTAHLPRPASSASSSPMLVAADGSRNAKRLSTGAGTALSAKPDVANAATSAAHDGCVRVVDLGSDGRTICTFSPSGNPTTLVRFSPCGRMILTADSLGHAFHVFELPLAGMFGNSAHRCSASVLHRYKLMRGITTADAVGAEWSPDAQWITVGTHSGTVHIYAINPFGGVPIIANHVQGKVKNPQVLQPFGVSLASVARSARPTPPPQQENLAKPLNATGAETAQTSSAILQMGASPRSFLLVNSSSRASETESEANVPFELLTSDPRSASVTLHSIRCWSTQARALSVSSSNLASQSTSPDPKQRFVAATSPRSSGLSQMMKRAGEGLIHGQHTPRLQADCVRIALWDQLAPEAGAVTKHSISTLEHQPSTSLSNDRASHASVARAEIETYSQSPAMLPTSIFLSRQTFFHSRIRNTKLLSPVPSSEPLRCLQRRGSRPVQVRRTARIVSREPSSEDPKSFDNSIAGALDQMSFDPHSLPQRSASAHIPSFPQGQRGRSSGWTSGSSIPIRIVAGGLGGIYRAGKELGRGVEMARRRTSGASGTTAPDASGIFPTTSTASVSFDGVDDVDLLGDDEPSARSNRRHYQISSGLDLGSARSDASLLSVLRNDEPSRGSQPSSAETPSTRFSEAEDAATDGTEADECDWDAIEASRSPAATEAPLLGMADRKRDQVVPAGDGLDDDFTVGVLDVDEEVASGEATLSHSRASLSPPQGSKSKTAPIKELVYALPAGASTRSSLLSQSSGLVTTLDARAESKDIGSTARESSPSNSEGSDSRSQASEASGLLCEGSKETYGTDRSPVAVVAELDASLKDSADLALDPAAVAKPIAVPVISTSGGGKKKKKKGGR